MEFLSRSNGGEGPLVAFGGSDGVIRVLSMITWKVCPCSTSPFFGSLRTFDLSKFLLITDFFTQFVPFYVSYLLFTSQTISSLFIYFL